MTSVVKEWDLNIFFEEVWDDHQEEYVPDKVLTINPVIWTNDNGVTSNDYTEIIWKTTFAEARYLRSQYPENEYGYDWTDTLEHFMEIAPVRLKELCKTLPNAHEAKVKELVG